MSENTRTKLEEFEKELETLLDKFGFEKTYSYFNGETGIWAFPEDRSVEINIGIKPNPDEDDIKNFEDYLND